MAKTACWIPGWYELDQSVSVGETRTFYFWKVIPREFACEHGLLFYNTLIAREAVLRAEGTVRRIVHPQLGELRSVDARGLDYTFTFADGRRALVNAEEEPGKPEDPELPASWSLLVEFAALDPLVPLT